MQAAHEAVVTAPAPARRIPWRSGLGYGLYALLAFAVFLVWLFPVDRLQTRLLEEVERRTRSVIEVEDRSWIFPLGMDLRGVQIAPADRPDRAMVLDSLRLRVALLPLLRLRVETDIVWEAYGGKARGSVSVSREADGARSTLDQFGSGFSLASLSGIAGGALQGVVQADLNCRWLNDAWWLGEGTGSVEVTGFKASGLTMGGFPVDALEFDSITGQLALNGGTVTLQRVAARGPLGTVSGDGTVLVRAPWTESVVNLTLRVQPSAGAATRLPILALAGGNTVTVRVSGRLAKPGVSINGAPLV